MGSMCFKNPDVVNLPAISEQENNKNSQRENENIEEITKFIEIERLNKKPKRISSQDSFSKEFKRGQYIGSGRLGRVYSGLSMNTGEIVAIKTIKICNINRVIDVVKAVERLCLLNHRNILKYRGTQVGQEEDEVDIITEFCNGGSITQLIETFNFFDEKLIKLYVKQILEGLVYLHENGIIHRNLKNSNVLVDKEGVVKLSELVISAIIIGDDPSEIIYFSTNNGKGNYY
jgi:serine/threonine protein kinase